jgi:spore photoproduct lyase
MYRSAHYVLFVNYQDFQDDIAAMIGQEKMTFFSGYDGDSLALDRYTGFLTSFLPFFGNYPSAEIELRTKSVAIQPLLKISPLPNVIIAYSLNPAKVVESFEQKTPSLKARIKALQTLQNHGWQIGLRFDPIIYVKDFSSVYMPFFEEIFQSIQLNLLHSVTLGAFRLPKPLYKTMREVLPKEEILHQCVERKDKKVGLVENLEESLLALCFKKICQWIPREKIFLCR